jgi:hypothetical protein
MTTVRATSSWRRGHSPSVVLTFDLDFVNSNLGVASLYHPQAQATEGQLELLVLELLQVWQAKHWKPRLNYEA